MNNSKQQHDVVREFHSRATRFYIINAAVLSALGVFLFVGWKLGWYREAFFIVTPCFLLWLFNTGRLLKCPACNAQLRSKEGLIRMPRACDSCGIALR